ncbi:VOC family protein [Actinomadura sp. 6N118]|uniref:VOC family protein n=1 Tax=Actinomadura sp. 6N118 TaxID=3375151 RepID=UPI0037897BE4
MVGDIGYLHHVGHVVQDMKEALALYQRLGFTLPPPAYPAMAPREGAPVEPFGAANTHAEFSRNFIELVTCVRDGEPHRMPSEAKLVALQAPAEVLPTLIERIANTSATIEACLRRFEGLHILFVQSPDIDAAAERLRGYGVRHGGVNTVRRPVETLQGTVTENVRYLEIDGDEPDARPGTVPEGRVGIAAGKPSGVPVPPHPNGATELADVVLCVADSELATVERRYETYLGQAARPGAAGPGAAGPGAAGPGHPGRVFDLDGTALTLVGGSDLEELLPGERPPALPALTAYAVTVEDIAVTRDLLRRNGFTLGRTAAGDIFVPAAAALGTAVIFREAIG